MENRIERNRTECDEKWQWNGDKKWYWRTLMEYGNGKCLIESSNKSGNEK